MTTAKKTGAKATRRRRRTQAKDVWSRSQMLVEILLEVMETEIAAEQSERSERWLKLFGPKDSAVVNLQKLVQVLGELQEQTPAAALANEPQPIAPVSEEELQMLSEWLKSVSAVSASPATE